MPVGSSRCPLRGEIPARFSRHRPANGIINETFDVKQMLELAGRVTFLHFMCRTTKSVRVELQTDHRSSNLERKGGKLPKVE